MKLPWMEESGRLSEPLTVGLVESAEIGLIGEQKLRQGFATSWSQGFLTISNRVRQGVKIQELESQFMWQLSNIPGQQ